MSSVAWLTDIHLNFVRPRSAVETFLAGIKAQSPRAVLISGDIAEADSVVRFLEKIDSTLGLPVYFVLGNHDFYRGSIEHVRWRVGELCLSRPNLKYLTVTREVVELTPRVGLVGHDGWADARVGDYEASQVMLNDYLVIDELAELTKEQRKDRLRQFGNEAALHVRRMLAESMEQYSETLLLTHVPPFRELCWHNKAPLDDLWAPHFACIAVGQVILEVMRDYPKRRLTVLCGHLHTSSEYNPLHNVCGLVGGAEYGHPAVVQMLPLIG
jgi:3',5'-cyclic AMP phosphodiesterase CpdA